MARVGASTHVEVCTSIFEDHVVVALAGSLDRDSATAVDDELAAAVELGLSLIVLDLDAVKLVTWAGLRGILLAARRAAEEGGRLTLVCTKDPVIEVLAVTGVSDHLGVHPSINHARPHDAQLL